MRVDRAAVQRILSRARAEGRLALRADEAADACRAYAVAVAEHVLATSPAEAAAAQRGFGGQVAMKVVAAEILHKTDVGGVRLGVGDADEAATVWQELVSAAESAHPQARIAGVLVQPMVRGDLECLIGVATDPTFGKMAAFGLGGVLVELMADLSFCLAPLGPGDALSMLDRIRGARALAGLRGRDAVDRRALAGMLEAVSRLATDFPEIAEIDLNPVMADPRGAVAVDARIVLGDGAVAARRDTLARDEIVASMRRIFRPRSVAVIGASAETGKIGNSVMRNLVDGGYAGDIYPIHPRETAILGRRCFASVLDVPGPVDLAVFAIPAARVAAVMDEVGRKGVAGAVMIPSGFAEVGRPDLQEEMVSIARRYGVRVIGPNIYGLYYTPEKLSATFCTAYDVRGRVALSSQSGGVGMSILGFGRSHGMGVSAIVGLGNKSDVDEDDLLAFFEEDEHTDVVAMHAEDLKDGRAFYEAARRITAAKPVIVLKAGRSDAGARAASSHTGALAGNDKVYGDILERAGVVRARSLTELLEFARALPVLCAPKGENVLILTGAGGSGVLLADACTDAGLELMTMPEDLDREFRRFIPPFGAAGNPVDITGGEPPSTYRATIALALADPRVDALVLGYWHTIVTPPRAFAAVVCEEVAAARARGQDKPVVASLVGDVEVEDACRTLWAGKVPAYAYTTEMPVQVLGAKYRWARAAGKVTTNKQA